MTGLTAEHFSEGATGVRVRRRETGHRDVTKNRRKVCGVLKERVTSINPMVVGSIPTGCESSVIDQRKKSRTADSRHNKTDVVKVRVTSAKERSGQPERCGIEKPPASQEASSSNNKREPIVPIGSAGMVRRRVTSSVKRRGTVVPRLCSIFLPARICRKGDGVGRGEAQGSGAKSTERKERR